MALGTGLSPKISAEQECKLGRCVGTMVLAPWGPCADLSDAVGECVAMEIGDGEQTLGRRQQVVGSMSSLIRVPRPTAVNEGDGVDQHGMLGRRS